MTQVGKEPLTSGDQGLAGYTYLSFLGLIAIMMLLLGRGLGGWSLLFAGIGLCGVTLRWRFGPPLTLAILALLLYVRDTGIGRFWENGQLFRSNDWILNGAVLVYLAAHYRLLGLTRAILPRDFRPAAGGTGKLTDTKRSPGLVSPWEIGRLLVAAPLCALLAPLAFRALPSEGYGKFLPGPWRGVVLAWVLALGLFVCAGLLDILSRRRMRWAEALLYLQDVLWTETRRDQARLNSWYTWARLRRPLKEKS